MATEGARAIGGYLRSAAAERLSAEVLDADAVLTERLSGGLRTVRGVPLGDLAVSAGRIEAAAGPLIGDGLLALEEEALRATPAGRLVLDGVTAELLAALDREEAGQATA